MIAVVDPAEKDESLLAVLNQVCRWRTAERFTTTQVRQRLEDAGLAGGVGAIDQVVLRVRFELDASQAAKALRRERLDRHPV